MILPSHADGRVLGCRKHPPVAPWEFCLTRPLCNLPFVWLNVRSALTMFTNASEHLAVAPWEFCLTRPLCNLPFVRLYVKPALSTLTNASEHSTVAPRELCLAREIHPLDPQPHRHSMLVPRVCAPRVTRYSLGKYWSRDWFRGYFSLTQGLWNQQAANPGVHMLSMTHSGVRQRNLMTHAQCPLPVYYSQVSPIPYVIPPL